MAKKEFNKKIKNLPTFRSMLRKEMKNPEFRREYLALKPKLLSTNKTIV